MSSHREAPETSKDPVADSTDVYAFRSPDAPDTVTLIANYIPFQKPDSGPNFFEFADDVVYDIRISNAGKAGADIIYRFRFSTTVKNPKTFLYNTGPITTKDYSQWNRVQKYTFSRFTYNGSKYVEQVLGKNLTCPPVNVGERSTPNYSDLAEDAVHTIGKTKVFAGQRADAFHVDLGSVFDLGGLRPYNQAHLIKLPTADGVNGLQAFNVHTLAVQVPITDLTRGGVTPTGVDDSRAVIGVYTTAMRQRSRVYDATKGRYVGSGAYQTVSRLANPLFNEVIVPMSLKDKWNSSMPNKDSAYASYVTKPELAALLPVLYPGDTFKNLAAYDKPRADLAAILLTGIPKGIVNDTFQNYTGAVQADMLRLNVAVDPADEPNNLGVLGGDLAGFPNGRRPADDVVAIELQAIAGKTIPLVDDTYTVDDAAKGLNDGTENTNADLLDHFPYLGLPGGGYETKPGTTDAENDQNTAKAGR